MAWVSKSFRLRGLHVASLDVEYEETIPERMNSMDLTTDAGMACLSCMGTAFFPARDEG